LGERGEIIPQGAQGMCFFDALTQPMQVLVDDSELKGIIPHLILEIGEID